MGLTPVSFEFLIFLTALAAAYYGPARRRQGLLLLGASYLFYALLNRWEYVLLLAAVTGLNHAAGRILDAAVRPGLRKVVLAASLGLNILVLAFFRRPSVPGPGAESGVLLPLGLSYIFCKAVGYTIDVYRRRIKSRSAIGPLALFLAFFPEILSGPIDRAGDLLPQIEAPKLFDEAAVVSGLRLILWGLFKKIVVANNLAVIIDRVFAAPRAYSGTALLLAAYALGLQIYSDFSGYTDIVRGVGRLLGYRLPENFRRPWLAESLAEFWTRWHITLSAWLRDYLFLPLAFRLSRILRSPRVLGLDSNVVLYTASALVTFLAAGIWHGSAGTFIAWGLLHGLFLSLSNATRRPRARLRRKWPVPHRFPGLAAAGRRLFCFHLVGLTWIFFRASSLRDAFYILRTLGLGRPAPTGPDPAAPLLPVTSITSKYALLVSALSALFLLVVESRARDGEIPGFLLSRSRSLRWGAYYLLLLAIFLLGNLGLREFLYVRF